jgi:hypothetical protein
MVCDKALGHLLENGIKPTYVLVCDASVNYEKYCEPYKDQLEDVILFINVCANPKWSELVKWKEIYFFANEDILESEKEFMKLSGCPNKIPAATNVSNAMVVLMTQSNNNGRNNFFGYDKYLLIGFDYSWEPNQNYYAFDSDGGGKHQYMRHHYLMNLVGDTCLTSNNLLFSAQWLDKYIKTFRLPIIQCTEKTILNLGKVGQLKDQMNYSFKPYHREVIAKATKRRAELTKELMEINQKLQKISSEHYFAALN